MKRVLMVLAILFFAVMPVTAFAETPMSLPLDSEPEAYEHNEEGISHFHQGQYDVALKHFEVSAAAQPTAEAKFNQALCMDKLGQQDQARKFFEEAKELADGNEKILTSVQLKSHLSQ